MSEISGPELLQAVPLAIAEARASHGAAMETLSRVLGRDETVVLSAIAEKLGWPTMSAADVEATGSTALVEVTGDVPGYALVLATAQGEQLAVLADPWNDALIATVREHYPEATMCLASALTCRLLRERGVSAEQGTPPMSSDSARGQRRRNQTDAATLDASKRLDEVVAFVQRTVEQGYVALASDIHFETVDAGLTVKLRMDGVLVDQDAVPDALAAEEVISRIKVLAALDIAERRVPQDGRFSMTLDGRAVDCRVSIMPSAHGEDAVIRLLDKRHLARSDEGLTLEALGLHLQLREHLRRLGRYPHGMLLVTGPTGSGKTTTLYAMLGEIRSGQEKIVTIEDPIEYDLPGVLQVPVSEKKGLTFARGLRSILRHDPDMIMVGEIRDRETADIAIQSALTGHLVFTTVHANNALDVVSRFTHMGVDLYGFVSCLNAVMAQRLIRLNCPQCSAPDASRRAGAELQGLSDAHRVVTRGRGCELCRNTGYKGRTAIGELIEVDDALRDLLVGRAPPTVVREHLAQRVVPLRDAAAALIAAGRTTPEEVARVLGPA